MYGRIATREIKLYYIGHRITGLARHTAFDVVVPFTKGTIDYKCKLIRTSACDEPPRMWCDTSCIISELSTSCCSAFCFERVVCADHSLCKLNDRHLSQIRNQPIDLLDWVVYVCKRERYTSHIHIHTHVIGGCRRNTISVPSSIDNPPHSSGSQKSHTHIHTYANTYANTYTYTYTHLHTHTWIGCKGLVHVVVLYEFEVREDECVLLDSCRGLCVQLFHGSQPRIPLGLCRSTHGVL
jgi:hypothetical protein